MSTNQEANANPVITRPAAPGGTVEAVPKIREDGNIILNQDGQPWTTAAEAQAFMRNQNLDAEKFGVSFAPAGGGYCVMKLALMLQRSQEKERAKENDQRAQIVKTPMRFHECIVLGANSDGKAETTAYVNHGGRLPHLIILGQKCILSEAELEVLDHATTDQLVPELNPDRQSRAPVAVVGRKPRYAVNVLRRDVPRGEVDTYYAKIRVGLNIFQAENKTAVKTQEG